MRKLLAVGAVVLGTIGTLLCAAAVGLGWWAAIGSVDRIDRVVARLDQGLSEADDRLARVEARLNAVRADFDDIREKIATLAGDNQELPRVRAEIERLSGRLVSAFDRAEAIADSLGSVAAALRTATDLVEPHDNPAVNDRVRNAADAVDRAANILNRMRARVDALKSATAVRLQAELFVLVRDAAAGSDRLAEGLDAARRELAEARGQIGGGRDAVVWWVHAAAIANTLVWIWGGLGQACLIGWGRRRFSKG